MELFYKKRKK